MTWFDAVILILGAMGLLILIGLGRKLEAKLDTTLNLVAGLTQSKPVMGPIHPDIANLSKPPEEKTVYHLTPEHDAKVLGDEDAG